MIFTLEQLQQLEKVPVEEVLLPVLIQLIIIIAAARLGGRLSRRLGQSAVVGEITAGVILGPSVLGQFAFFHQLFHPSLHSIADPLAGPVFHWLFTGLSQIGLILLLLLIGLEFDFGHLRLERHGRLRHFIRWHRLSLCTRGRDQPAGARRYWP